jgi:hypothetical protein
MKVIMAKSRSNAQDADAFTLHDQSMPEPGATVNIIWWIIGLRQKTLIGLTPGNIQAMHIKQESGTMMGKQVLVF